MENDWPVWILAHFGVGIGFNYGVPRIWGLVVLANKLAVGRFCLCIQLHKIQDNWGGFTPPDPPDPCRGLTRQGQGQDNRATKGENSGIRRVDCCLDGGTPHRGLMGGEQQGGKEAEGRRKGGGREEAGRGKAQRSPQRGETEGGGAPAG